jgi:hypothetical protein
MGLSEFAIKPGVQLIGDAKQGTNVAIRSIVSINRDATEFNFGFSKTEGMWDGAGWQVWIRPKYNQVFLAHGETDWQTSGQPSENGCSRPQWQNCHFRVQSKMCRAGG